MKSPCEDCDRKEKSKLQCSKTCKPLQEFQDKAVGISLVVYNEKNGHGVGYNGNRPKYKGRE